MDKKLKERAMSSNKVVAYNLIGKFLLNGINFFVVSIFTRLLGTENYGLFSLYLTWQGIVLILMGLQTQSIIGNISIRFPIEERKCYFSSNTIVVTVIFLIFILIMLLLRKPLVKFTGFPIGILMFMLLHAYASYGVNVVTGTWAFDKLARKNFIVSLLLSFFNIGLSIFLIIRIDNSSEKYIGRIVGSAAPTVVYGLGCIVYLIYKGRTLFNKEYLKYTLAFSIPIVFHALSNLILNQSDRIMLQKMGTLSDVGIYSVIFTLVNMLNILMEAFNTAWVPFFYEDLKNGVIIKVKEKSRNYLKLYTAIVIGFLLVAPEVLGLYAGAEYSGNTKAMPFLAIGSFFIYLYSFPVNFKYYQGKTVSIAVGTISASLCNIVLNSVLISCMGIYGASIATMISYMLLWLFHFMGAKLLKDSVFPYNYMDFVPSIFIVVIVAILSYTLVYNLPVVRWITAIIDGIYLLYSVHRRKNIW